MKERIRKVIRLGILISLSVLLLFLAFRDINISEILRELKEADYSWVLLAFVASIAAFISRARRWILLIRPLGYKPSLKSAYHALMTGYLFNFAAPRLGELSRCIALGKKEKIPVDSLFGTVIAERAFDLASILILMVVMLFAGGDIMDSFMRHNILQPLGDKISGSLDSSLMLIIIPVLFLAAVFIMMYVYRERLKKVKIFAKFSDIMKGIAGGLRSFTRMKDKLEFIILTIIIWAFYIVMTWVVFYALPSTSHLHLGDALFILVIGSLGMAAPVQGGIGAFHWIVSRGLNIVYGIDLKDALAYATLSHESQMILIALLGTVSFYLIARGRKRIKMNLNSEGNGKE